MKCKRAMKLLKSIWNYSQIPGNPYLSLVYDKVLLFDLIG